MNSPFVNSRFVNSKFAGLRDCGGRALGTLTLAAVATVTLLLAGCEPPPVESVQRGYRGTGMDELYHPKTVAELVAANHIPDPQPAANATPGVTAGAIYKNVKVLGDLEVGSFARTMAAMTQWVAPEQGCAYCHNPADFASDALYTKVVARRMLQMTQHINADWKPHVAGTGVTCYTCHRGNPVPNNVWYTDPGPTQAMGMAGNRAGQNAPAPSVGLSSLPNDPLTAFLDHKDTVKDSIRVVSTTALPEGNRHSIKQTEWTYGLMMHMSQSLGVNCTYCHNSRSFTDWDQSTPQRTTAWYGIRMVQDLNTAFLDPLASTFPDYRHGALGDGPKLNCATCHQGAYKPLLGASMLKDHPELATVHVTVSLPPTEGSATGAVLYFGVGSANLAGDANTGMEPLVAALKANPKAKAVISGYHSAAGDLAQNQELAKQRALAVRDALKAAGIAENRVVLDKPQQTEANVSGEDPKARRVEISLK